MRGQTDTYGATNQVGECGIVRKPASGDALESHKSAQKTLRHESISGVGEAAYFDRGSLLVQAVIENQLVVVQMTVKSMSSQEHKAKLIELARLAVSRLASQGKPAQLNREYHPQPAQPSIVSDGGRSVTLSVPQGGDASYKGYSVLTVERVAPQRTRPQHKA